MSSIHNEILESFAHNYGEMPKENVTQVINHNRSAPLATDEDGEIWIIHCVNQIRNQDMTVNTGR